MRAVLVVALVSLLPASAFAQRGTRAFGDPGVVSPMGSLSMSRVSTDEFNGTPSTSTVKIDLEPGVWVFAAPGFAVGGLIGLSTSKTEGKDATTTFSFGPGLGYDARLGRGVSLFPTVSLLMSVTSQPNDVTLRRGTLAIDVPLLLHYGNFFLGAGPYLTRTLWAKAESGGLKSDLPKYTAFGVNTTIGGWL